jgi:predicted TIM-barrel fold metal-dependent hydrolase
VIRDFSIVDSHVHSCDPQRLSYGWVDIVGEISAGCSQSERRKLFGENAIAFYRLDA